MSRITRNQEIQKTNGIKARPPLVIKKGRQEPAYYRDQEVPEYCGNPLIEALPPIWAAEEVEERLIRLPQHEPEQRGLPAHIRLHLIERCREIFVPNAIHFDIETKISCMLRRGYQIRNPVAPHYSPELQQRLESQSFVYNGTVLQAKARGFAVVGFSGMGKSTAVENILLEYPQVIDHSKYKERDLILRQVVWLTLVCPQDGSIKGLCINFFQILDEILGTTYSRDYVSAHSTVDVLLPRMARVAALQALGVLVIDEIQNLSRAKSGGAEQMLSFFVQLEDTIGLPFILIGTSDAVSLLQREFRHARRASEQGDVVWPRLREIAEPDTDDEKERSDPVWENLVRVLWRYYFLRQDTPLKENLLTDELSHALYKNSQGITAVAVTVYFLAQRRAIVTNFEKITPGLIHTVAKDNQRLIAAMLHELRSGVYPSPYACQHSVDHKDRSPMQREIVGGRGDLVSSDTPDSSTEDRPRSDDVGEQTQGNTGLDIVTRKPASPPKKRQKRVLDQGDVRRLSATPGAGTMSDTSDEDTDYFRSLGIISKVKLNDRLVSCALPR